MSENLGTIVGRNVVRVGTNYVFGCGAVKIPVARVHNFVRELNLRHGQRGKTKQENDYHAVLRIAGQNGHNNLTDRATAQQILTFFGKHAAKDEKKATPRKVVPKKEDATKAVPKKAAKKK